jgi:hypothetical protein
MKTFVAENVLQSYRDGMIVVKTTSRKRAIEIIRNQFPYHGFYSDCGNTQCSSEYCLKHRLREMEDDEIVFIWGSD